MNLTEGIWSRTGANEMSKNSFVRAVAFFTLVAGAFVALGSVWSYSWDFSWMLLLGSLGVSVAAIVVFHSSDNFLISFFGVSVMSLALGAMMGPVIALYSLGVVLQAIVTTGGIMVVMSVMGILFPNLFEGFAPYVLGALTLLIIVQFSQLIFMSMGFEQAYDMDWITWVGIGIFTILVAFDWSRALSLPYTLDNAVDASGGLILDAVNLFIRLLEIYAKANGSSSSRRR